MGPAPLAAHGLHGAARGAARVRRTPDRRPQGVLVAPVSFVWNNFLERAIPGTALRAVLSKVLANGATLRPHLLPGVSRRRARTGLFAPVQISLSFTTITLLSGKTLVDARRKVQHDLPVTFAVGGMYWPVVGFIQFRFVPVRPLPPPPPRPGSRTLAPDPVCGGSWRIGRWSAAWLASCSRPSSQGWPTALFPRRC
jgi:hypothetical protein